MYLKEWILLTKRVKEAGAGIVLLLPDSHIRFQIDNSHAFLCACYCVLCFVLALYVSCFCFQLSFVSVLCLVVGFVFLYWLLC